MKYKIAVFDMDGTILNTLIDMHNSCNFALKKNNFPERTYDEVRMFVGNGIPKLIERAVPVATDDEMQKAVLTDFMKHYNVHCADNTCPYEGIPELISQLKKSGLEIAVNTNKAQEAAEKLTEEYFAGLFDYVAGAVEARKKKPASDGIDFLLMKAGLEKSQAVYIGDSDVDFMTAKNAGLDFIGCDWGFRGEAFLREHGADVVVKRPAEILELVK